MTGTLAEDKVRLEALLATATQFLGLEARLLDEGREEEWLDLLGEQLQYVVPVRQATEPRSNEISKTSFRLRENKATIAKRVERLNTGFAYAEVPPSRTLRVVGSIEVTGFDGDVVDVSSALLLYRQRGIDPHFHLIPARRYDKIQLTPSPQLVWREVILTETVLATPNLGVFL
ncbi:aromatic-ring-hydroxylating dioxygenase subunit beta [[Mycobacterium] burgundiense]|uniref:Aromatic-ring-hydroxylating dioxygenase subunit beta n=1 Tax=[Mycobacterium] burgundiense TaxID=3064286 RepID=A0ABM9M4B5_9MYCO|nr:aromatic-ring-hydroxylating dioxygenase subunit beta [Mycolicibacterium sp. MU0053]CAJ1509988.1 aromatic-ring-hydroxylating dioxygenase subunit beta [Mycolicibacterium sp. MU0053]